MYGNQLASATVCRHRILRSVSLTETLRPWPCWHATEPSVEVCLCPTGVRLKTGKLPRLWEGICQQQEPDTARCRTDLAQVRGMPRAVGGKDDDGTSRTGGLTGQGRQNMVYEHRDCRCGGSVTGPSRHVSISLILVAGRDGHPLHRWGSAHRVQAILRAIRRTKLRAPASVFSPRVRRARGLRSGPNQPSSRKAPWDSLAAHQLVPAFHKVPEQAPRAAGARALHHGLPEGPGRAPPPVVAPGPGARMQDPDGSGRRRRYLGCRPTVRMHGALLPVQTRRLQGRPVDRASSASAPAPRVRPDP